MISIDSRFLLIFLEIWLTSCYLSDWILYLFYTTKKLVISFVFFLTRITIEIVVFGKGVEEWWVFSFAILSKSGKRKGEQARKFSYLGLAGEAISFLALREGGRFEFIGVEFGRRVEKREAFSFVILSKLEEKEGE